MTNPKRKVVITGCNIISSLGLNWETTWQNLVSGESGVRQISTFNTAALQTQIAAQVPPEFDAYAKNFITRRVSGQMTRVTRMCYVCAKDAITLSGIDFDNFDRTRCAVILGVVSTGNTSVEKDTTSKNRVLKNMNNAMSAWISLEYKLMGPNFTVSAACASSAYAIGIAYDMIKNGMADVVIAGGADSIVNPEEIEGFNELFALSVENTPPEKASKPFSANRDGFVIGEGAGILVLESEASALARNAEIYGEIAGYGISSEAYNIMAPMKDGEGIAHTIQIALQNAGISPEDVDYINAHGTSTLLNDKYETMAIEKVFGERARTIPVSSSKSMIGHTIGAAGAIEGIITMLSVKNQLVTPTINLDIPDPELNLDYVPHAARAHRIRYALSNSFAFGGHNATLVFKNHTL
ncbi:MAG: beta-ketoacyl-[acyl-carrier-protein] synthase family protein [Lentimicrobiaceae bacterium]|nr:beta-ketoacyl-[acyl-carrier-protein] synthase family protein [Lentimicrobiaceae bacterium]